MERAAAATVFLLSVCPAWSDNPSCDINYYRELDCKPVFEKDGKCPMSYQCPEFHPDKTKCYYKGVSFNKGERIPDNMVTNPCSQVCICEVSNVTTSPNADEQDALGHGISGAVRSEATAGGLMTHFQCAAVDCMEYFDDGDTDEECLFVYSTLDDCCSSDKVCGKSAIEKLAKCQVDSQVYREGQKFFPSKTCKQCLCTKDYNGTFEGAPYCKDVDCGVEIHFQNEISEKCAPVVMSGSSCCPHKFECPDSTTEIIRSTDTPRLAGAMPCQFGNATLAVGDQVTVKDKCIKCSCEKPPLVSCVQQSECRN